MAKVLIVEDNNLNLKLFRDLVLFKQHEPIISSNGLGVLKQVIEEEPQLIFMDIQLGQVSGLDLIKELKKNSQTTSIPIVAITAFAMKNEAEKISNSGCDLYLTKPVSIDKFFAALEKFL